MPPGASGDEIEKSSKEVKTRCRVCARRSDPWTSEAPESNSSPAVPFCRFGILFCRAAARRSNLASAVTHG